MDQVDIDQKHPEKEVSERDNKKNKILQNEIKNEMKKKHTMKKESTDALLNTYPFLSCLVTVTENNVPYLEIILSCINISGCCQYFLGYTQIFCILVEARKALKFMLSLAEYKDCNR